MDKKLVNISNMFKTKQELVYYEIKSAIIECEYLPCEKLIIKSLASKYNVSESPVREAIKRLISEDFLTEQGGTIFVAPISEIEFIDMLDVRLELERITVKLAAKKASDNDILDLSKTLHVMKESFNNGEMKQYDKHHKEFHIKIFKLCGVKYLLSAVYDALEHSERGINYFKLKAWQSTPSIIDHEMIFSAIKDNNPEEADKWLALNRKKAFDLYKKQINDMLDNKNNKR
ncbi:MAG: GntR family transcriptional regulator [Dethiosulfatibacter sp.]|nr:GntR family transcriptional regulator [Dethiosulfatibacter sp.]